MNLVLIKAGFTSKETAALFAMNWNILNQRPIHFKEENFGLFSLYSVYYIVCDPKGVSTGGLSVKTRG